MKVWVSQPQTRVHGRYVPISDLSCGGMGREMKPLPQASMTEAGWKPDPAVIRMEELSPTPTSCNIQESRSCTSPERYNRIYSISPSVGEPAPKSWAGDCCPHFPSVGPTLYMPRLRPRVMICPASASTLSRICWNMWRSLTCRIKAAGSPQHRVAVGCPGNFEVEELNMW